GHGARTPEPRAVPARASPAGAAEDARAVPLPLAPGGDVLPRGGHAAGRRVGLVLLGTLLGLGPQGDLGAHRAARLPGRAARPADRLVQGLRPGRRLDLRLPAGADGLVRLELRAGHRPARVRL